MATRKNNKRQHRELEKILNAGVTALVLGIAFFMAPSFLSKSGNLKGVGAGLGNFALPAFGGGLLLIGVYFALKQLGKKPANSPTIPVLTDAVQVPPASSSWSPAVFAAIEWRRFEAVCERFFAQSGLKTKTQSHGADGGVDIWLYSAHAEGPVSIAQCKHWRNEVVTVKEIREFFGVMASHKLQRGTFVTTSTYTTGAQKFANENGINALDGDKLLKLIASRTAEQQKELLDIAYKGEYSIPTCASCGIKLVKRTKFWGCKNFPRCKSQIYFKAA